MIYVIIMSMRIDRLLCEMNIGSRSQVKELLKKGLVTVNGTVIKKADTNVNEHSDVIICEGRRYMYQPFVYYMMNKPAGILSATRDAHQRTVLDLLSEELKKQNQGDLTGIPVKDIFPVGRLDKDTVGLLLLTNDGELAHRLLSPKKHVAKKYYVKTDCPIGEKAADLFAGGIDIGEGQLTKPAVLERLGSREFNLTITEGRFHQVKRMFQAVGASVIYLKRISMGGLILDETLPEGHIRELSKEEVLLLC